MAEIPEIILQVNTKMTAEQRAEFEAAFDAAQPDDKPPSTEGAD